MKYRFTLEYDQAVGQFQIHYGETYYSRPLPDKELLGIMRALVGKLERLPEGAEPQIDLLALVSQWKGQVTKSPTDAPEDLTLEDLEL